MCNVSETKHPYSYHKFPRLVFGGKKLKFSVVSYHYKSKITFMLEITKEIFSRRARNFKKMLIGAKFYLHDMHVWYEFVLYKVICIKRTKILHEVIVF